MNNYGLHTCVLLLTLIPLVGCQDTSRNVEVTITGSTEPLIFPSQLVGIWQADKHPCQIVFEEDGTVSSVIIPFGEVEMFAGKTTRDNLPRGGKGVFEPGKWTVSYDTDSKELFVEIIVADFYQDLGPNAIKGNLTDMFIGPVSVEEGVWSVDWFTHGKYIALTPEPKEFYNESEPEFRDTMTFTKVEPDTEK